MIYSEAFDALPTQAKEAVYRRMWRLLPAGGPLVFRGLDFRMHGILW
jgi:hypothetical protein